MRAGPALDFWIEGKQNGWNPSKTVSGQVTKALGPCYQTVMCGLVLLASIGSFYKCRIWGLNPDLWDLQFKEVPRWFVSTEKFEKHCFRGQNQLLGKTCWALNVTGSCRKPGIYSRDDNYVVQTLKSPNYELGRNIANCSWHSFHQASGCFSTL